MQIQIPRVFAFLNTPKRNKVAYGGRGGAKSWGYVDTALVHGMAEKLRFLCAREIQKSIKDSIHRLLSDRIKAHGLEWFYTIKNETIIGKNGTEFLFAGLKHNVTQIKSFEGVDRALIEEAENVSNNSWEILIPTIRKPGSEIWVIFNVKNITDPTYQRFVATQSDDTIAVKVSWRDNPFFPEVLRHEMEKLKITDYEAYLHIWEGEPDTRRNGAVYAKQLAKALEEQRITTVPYDPAYEVFTAWDLGFGNSTAIWWLQFVGRELRWLEYYENNGEQLEHYIRIVKEKNYNYIKQGHFLPHDGGAGNIRGDSVSKQLDKLGLTNTVLPRESDITPGIELLRQTISYSVFDKDKCKDGLHALNHYGYEWDDDRQVFKDRPRHDWTSDGSDSARYASIAAARVKAGFGKREIITNAPKTIFVQPRSANANWMGG